MKNSTRFFVASTSSLVFFLLAGCSNTTPQTQQSVQDLREQYTITQKKTDNNTFAPVAMYEAEKAVKEAEAAVAAKKANDDAVQHLVFVAHKKIELAELEAARKSIESHQQRLAKERQQVLLESKILQASDSKSEARNARLETLKAEAEAAELQKQVEAANAQANSAKTAAEQMTAEAAAAAKAAEEKAKKLALKTSALEKKLKDFETKRTERGLIITLKNGVLFALDQATLQPGVKESLEPLTQALLENKEISVSIEGHTDSTGSSEYNQALSEKRAEAVRAFLASRGIAPTRMTSMGYGETAPVSTNATLIGRQLNRRVEVVLLGVK